MSCSKTHSSPAKAGRRQSCHQKGQNASRAHRSMCAITNTLPEVENGRTMSTKFCKAGLAATGFFRTVAGRSPASICRETCAIHVGWMVVAPFNRSSR